VDIDGGGTLVLAGLALVLVYAAVLRRRPENPRRSLLVYFALLSASSTLGVCYFSVRAASASVVNSTLNVVIALCLAFFAGLGALAFWRLYRKGPDQ
jgi:hypothetical protein